MAAEPAALSGFGVEPFSWQGRTHQVYRAGSGPAVVVVHEIPGLHPGVADFGRRLVADGFTVFLPSLFGTAGAAVSAGAVARSMTRVCVGREFSLLADRAMPGVHWLRALAAYAHEQCGGPGVGAIGMCFSGGYALAMAVEPAVLASVLSQPATPLGLTAARRRQVGLDATELAAVAARTGQGLCVLGLRFSHDRISPRDRFERLREVLGGAFEDVQIDSSPGNGHGIPQRAHSVLTVDLVDSPGHPTRGALDRVREFLGRQLGVRS